MLLASLVIFFAYSTLISLDFANSTLNNSPVFITKHKSCKFNIK